MLISFLNLQSMNHKVQHVELSTDQFSIHFFYRHDLFTLFTVQKCCSHYVTYFLWLFLPSSVFKCAFFCAQCKKKYFSFFFFFLSVTIIAARLMLLLLFRWITHKNSNTIHKGKTNEMNERRRLKENMTMMTSREINKKYFLYFWYFRACLILEIFSFIYFVVTSSYCCPWHMKNDFDADRSTSTSNFDPNRETFK